MFFTKSFIFTVFFFSFFQSCQHSLPQYLVSQGLQQGSLYIHAQENKSIIHDPLREPSLKKDLLMANEVLSYAQNHLDMKTGANYTHYTQLNRNAVSYVVVAAQQDRLESHLFQFPIFGALPYRGYFKKSQAEAFSQTLADKNLDISVRPVSAYSSTGWLADPIVSSMRYNTVEFIELIFHELLHLQFYLPNEADFNEAYATWFAQKATFDFIQHNQSIDENTRSSWIEEYKKYIKIENLKLKKTKEVLSISKEFYSNPNFTKLSFEEKLIKRKELFETIKSLYAQEPSLKHLAEMEWNNAILSGLSTYYSWVPKINEIYLKSGLKLKEFLITTTKNPKLILSQIQP